MSDKYLATCGIDIKIHDYITYKCFDSYQNVTPSSDQGTISDISWSVDHKCLAILPNSGSVRIINIKDHKFSSSSIIEIPFRPTSVSFMSNTNRYLAVGTEQGTLVIWDCKTKNIRKTFESVDKDAFKAIDFNVFDNHIAASSSRGKILVFDYSSVTNMETSYHVPNSRVVTSIRFTSKYGSSLLAAGSEEGHVTCWDTLNKSQVYNIGKCHSSDVTDLSFSRVHFKLLASVSSDMHLVCHDVNLAGARPVIRVETPQRLTSVDLCPDGNMAVVGTAAGSLMTYDLRSYDQPMSVVNVQNGAVNKLRFTPENALRSYTNGKRSCASSAKSDPVHRSSIFSPASTDTPCPSGDYSESIGWTPDMPYVTPTSIFCKNRGSTIKSSTPLDRNVLALSTHSAIPEESYSSSNRHINVSERGPFTPVSSTAIPNNITAVPVDLHKVKMEIFSPPQSTSIDRPSALSDLADRSGVYISSKYDLFSPIRIDDSTRSDITNSSQISSVNVNAMETISPIHAAMDDFTSEIKTDSCIDSASSVSPVSSTAILNNVNTVPVLPVDSYNVIMKIFSPPKPTSNLANGSGVHIGSKYDLFSPIRVDDSTRSDITNTSQISCVNANAMETISPIHSTTDDFTSRPTGKLKSDICVDSDLSGSLNRVSVDQSIGNTNSFQKYQTKRIFSPLQPIGNDAAVPASPVDPFKVKIETFSPTQSTSIDTASSNVNRFLRSHEIDLVALNKYGLGTIFSPIRLDQSSCSDITNSPQVEASVTDNSFVSPTSNFNAELSNEHCSMPSAQLGLPTGLNESNVDQSTVFSVSTSVNEGNRNLMSPYSMLGANEHLDSTEFTFGSEMDNFPSTFSLGVSLASEGITFSDVPGMNGSGDAPCKASTGNSKENVTAVADPLKAKEMLQLMWSMEDEVMQSLRHLETIITKETVVHPQNCPRLMGMDDCMDDEGMTTALRYMQDNILSRIRELGATVMMRQIREGDRYDDV